MKKMALIIPSVGGGQSPPIPFHSWIWKLLVLVAISFPWWQDKELIEDADEVDNAVSGRRADSSHSKHHCCPQPQRTKLYSSKKKAILRQEEKRNFRFVSLAARPTSSTICHLPPQRPLCRISPPLHVNSSPTTAISDFSTLPRLWKNCSSCSRRIPPLLLRPSRAHNGF